MRFLRAHTEIYSPMASGRLLISNPDMLNFVLWLFFFFYLHTDKNIAVLSQLGFFALILTVLFKHTFDTQSIHIVGPVYYLSNFRNSPFYIRWYTYGKRSFVDYSRVRL